MTALTGFLLRQFDRTTHSTRRLRVIMAMLIIIAGTGLLLLFDRAPEAVTYNSSHVPVISPIETQVCPGDIIHYPLVTEVTTAQIPGQVSIAESWCKEGLTGSCVGVQPPRTSLPLLEPKRIISDGTPRTVPDTLAPGVYHFWHSATNARGEVSGYIVAPVVVISCSAK